MKGMELPISTIVIIVIVLIVLLAVIAFFFGVWNPGVGGISLEAAKNSACQMLVSTGCGKPEQIMIRDFDADQDGNMNEVSPNYGTVITDCGDSNSFGDNLAMLCLCWYNIPYDDCGATVCHCD